MPISSARMKTMFGGRFCTWALTTATSRQAAKTAIFMFLSSMHIEHAEKRWVELVLSRDLVGGAW